MQRRLISSLRAGQAAESEGRTCPLLGGMGITAGEGMPHKMDSKVKEAWLWDTYGEGVRDAAEKEAALRHLGEALDHWKRYAAVRDAHYVPALYNRVGYVNVTELTEKAAADIEIARNWKPGSLKDDGRRSGSEKGFRQ